MTQYITVLFKRQKKHIPKWLEESWIGDVLHLGLIVFISAWIFQGVLITNWREVIIKYAIDAILTTIMVLFGVNWLVAFLIAHTINFAIDGQLFAMYTHMGATGVPAEKFLKDTIELSKKIEKHKFIKASIAYGSLSRGCFKSTSDIDIRLIPENGGWWQTAFYAVWLRTWAFFIHYPLDLYCYDPEVVVKKMRSDELPIMVNETDKCMMQWYPERVEFDEFIEIFTRENLK